TAFSSVSGGAGYDRVYLSGTAGNTLNLGTAGIEYLSGGNGNDSFDGTSQTVALFIDGNLGDDTLRGGSSDDSIYGNNGDNTLYGNGGDDNLYCGTGNDYLNGGTGNDYMAGGAGNDIYVVDSLGDSVSEASGAGNDRVYAYVNETLGANVESLYLSGTATTGTGNTLNNLLYGNGYDNILSGLSGNDSLYGNAGNDTLTGGAGIDYLNGGTGQDRFVFSESGSTNRDTIGGFSHTDDTIVLMDILDGADDSSVTGLSFNNSNVLYSGWYFEGAGFNGNGAQLSGIYNDTDTGYIWYNPTSSAAGDSVLICTVGSATAASLDNTDFVYAA
ncbi:Hemolysin-type calcium-binding repeat-containing protein, partial [Syntrophus gentianae]